MDLKTLAHDIFVTRDTIIMLCLYIWFWIGSFYWCYKCKFFCSLHFHIWNVVFMIIIYTSLFMLSCVHLTILLITQYLCLKLAVNSIFFRKLCKSNWKKHFKICLWQSFFIPFHPTGKWNRHISTADFCFTLHFWYFLRL